MTQQPLRALHIGDLHFWDIPLNPMAYLGKRAAGVGNLIYKRSRQFRKAIAPQLASRVTELDVDTILFSGDFSTTSLASEFAQATRVFEPVVENTNSKVAYVVPGNHDCYTKSDLGAEKFARCLPAPFIPVRGIEFVMLNQGVGMVAINATTSNGMDSFGRITEEHLQFAREKVLPAQDQFKALWILCHFPAEEPPGVLRHDRGDQLRGSEPLLDLLKEIPQPKFWLHGHHHYRWAFGSPKVPNLVWLNAGAPLMMRGKTRPDLGFHQLVFMNDATHLYSHRRDPASGDWHHKAVPVPDQNEYVNLQDWE